MKLPKGKIDETITGGLDVLKDKIEELKSKDFSGYLTITKQEKDGELQGQVVLLEGVPVLTECITRGKTKTGADAVIPIIKASLNEESNIEVHSAIDVSLMIQFFSKAKITEEDFHFEKKLTEMKELDKKRKEKKEKRELESQKRGELEEQLKSWKMDGYVVKGLEKIFNDDLEKVQDAFDDFKRKVNKLTELDDRLSKIDTAEYKEQVQQIETKLNDPDLIFEIEKDLSKLEDTINEEIQRQDELMKRVDGWKDEGYNVAHLSALIKNDMASAWDEFTSVMDTIQKLKEYEAMVKKVNPKGFEDDVNALLTKLKDVTALDEVMENYSKLEQKIKEDKEKKVRLTSVIDDWERNGFDVTSIKSVFDEPFDIVEEKFLEFEKGIQELQALKDRLDQIKHKELENEVQEMQGSLFNVGVLEELTAAVSELEKKAEELNTKKEGLRAILDDLKNKGYNVEELEQIMDEKLDVIMEKFEVFEDKKKQLEEIGNQLNEMDVSGFSDEVDQIKAKLTDVNAIDEINEIFSGIKEKIDAQEEEENTIKTKLEEIAKEGFIVTKMEELLKGDRKGINEAFNKFQEDIERLKGLKNRLESTDAPGHEEEINKLKDKIMDTNNLPEIEDELNSFIEGLAGEVKRREEIKAAIQACSEEGYDLSGINIPSDDSLAELEKCNTEIENSITKLKSFKEQLESLDTKWHEEEVSKIKEQLNSPGAIVEIEKAMSGLVETLENEQKHRKELKDQLERWREEGFDVSIMDDVMDQQVDKISEKAIEVNESINKLNGFKEQLDALDTKWFENEIEEIKAKLKGPVKVNEIEDEFNELMQKIETTKQRREELKSKYESWKDQGFNLEPLDGILDKELSEMESAFETFEKDLNQLLELQKKMGVKVQKAGAEPVKGEKKPTEEKEEETKPEKEKEAQSVKLVLGSPLELVSEYVFDTYVVGASNRFTHAAALAVAEAPAEAYNPLFIYGGVGLGKTHLLNAVGNHIKHQDKKRNIVYTTSEKFTNELINSIRYDRIEEFRKLYRTADVLIIDDIQFLAGKESTQEEFFHTFNTLYTAHKQIVISSDRPPREIPQLEERLKSRFEGGLITDIQPPSLETKIIILRREAKKQKVDVPDEVMHLIASKVKSNIRELQGALTKIVAYSKLTDEVINEALAKDVLKDFLAERPSARATDVEEPMKKSASKKPLSVSDGLSSIEKRLSSLKKKLSPILNRDREKAKEEKKEVEATKEEPVAAEVQASKPAKEPMPEPEKEAAPVETVAEAGTESAPEPEVGPGPEKQAAPEQQKPKEPTAPETPTTPGPEEIVSGEIEEEGEKEVELAKCGNCGELVPADSAECSNCGVSFGAETYECPLCHGSVNTNELRCESCGTEFEVIEEEEEKKKKKKKKKKRV